MKTYLSRFHFGPFSGHAWQAIHNESPLGPERRTRQEAERDFSAYGATPTAIWDSYTGNFRPLEWDGSR